MAEASNKAKKEESVTSIKNDHQNELNTELKALLSDDGTVQVETQEYSALGTPPDEPDISMGSISAPESPIETTTSPSVRFSHVESRNGDEIQMSFIEEEKPSSISTKELQQLPSWEAMQVHRTRSLDEHYSYNQDNAETTNRGNAFHRNASHHSRLSEPGQRNSVQQNIHQGLRDNNTFSGQIKHLGNHPKRRSVTYASQLSLARDSLRELAKTALMNRNTFVGDVTFDNPTDDYVRESIRRIQAYSRRDAPIELEVRARMLLKNRRVDVRMDRDEITWYKRSTEKGKIFTDDIVGAQVLYKPGVFRIHYFTKGKGTGERALRREYNQIDFTCPPKVATNWVNIIQELVRWQARAPPIEDKRRIKVVINPHSGKRRAQKIWLEKVKIFFDLGNFDYCIEETEFSGHATEMGRKYEATDAFEAIVFIGGDGTLCEFMNGLLSRPEHEWREIVASTPLSLISAGTQNAFGLGVGIPTVEAALYCIIKRKMRPLDVITVASSKPSGAVQYSYCGLGWGIAGDIAAESERYRYMGTSRYAFLKIKQFLVKPRKHTGSFRYVPVDPQPELRTYDEIKNEGATDQFEIEEGNVYDYENLRDMRKSWTGAPYAVRSPASKTRYPAAAWKEEKGEFLVVGVVNTAPDGQFSHPSDGCLDLIVSRKGNILSSLHLVMLYLFGKELRSPLMQYIKVKAVEIDPDHSVDCMNIDGEVLSGPGPWRMEVVPSLFKALSEK